MSFSEWKEVRLGDIVESISNRHKFDKDKIVLINTSDVLDGKVLNHTYVENKNLKGQFKKSFQKGDILYSEIRPKNRRFAYIDFKATDYVASTKLMVLRKSSESVDNVFLYQILKSESIINRLQVLAETRSGTFPQITYTELANLKVNLPPLKEQKAIANIFSTLDEKIEVNNKINKTLEKMAQIIFKHWFIDFEFPNENGEPYKSSGGEMVESELGMIPKGWEIKTIEEITSKFTTGLNPRKNFVLGRGNNYYVTIKNMYRKSIILDDRCDKIDNEAIKMINKRSDLRKGDILFSAIGTIGRIYLIDETPKNWNISESIFTLRSSNEKLTEFLYLLMLSTDLQAYCKQLASGSVQKGIRMSDLKKYKFALSVDLATNEFRRIISPIIKEYKTKQKENMILANIRDALLPMLMSGEIRIPFN